MIFSTRFQDRHFKFSGIKLIHIFIFPQGLIEICLLVWVLDRFPDFHVTNLKGFVIYFSLMFIFYDTAL